MRSAVAEALPAGQQRRVVICTVTLADGRTIRAATSPVLVSADQGGPWLYDHHLDGIDDFTAELDLYSLDATASLTQVRVGIAATDDIGALAEANVPIAAATAEVAYLWPGDPWEARVVLLAGSVQAAEIGRVGETTDFTIEAAPVVTSAVLGDDTRDVGTDYPPTLLDTNAVEMTDVTGESYPIILGSPKSVAAFKVGNVGGTNRLVIAGHHLPGTGTVEVFKDGASDGTETPANGSVTTGDIAYVSSAAKFFSADGTPPNQDGAYTVSFDQGGIACYDDKTRATKSAADVMRWLLGNSGLRVDWRRMGRTLDLLASWPVGIAITSQTTHIDVARSLAKVLPIIEVPGSDGTWFAYTEISSLPVEGALRLGHELVGGIGKMVVSDRDNVRNSFTINYWDDRFNGEFAESLTVDSTNHPLCAISADPHWYGEQAADVVESAAIWDAVTARRVLNAMADRQALQHRSRSYVLAPDAYYVAPGQLRPLYDSDYGVAGHLAYVRAVSVVAPLVVTLDLVDRSPASAL